MIRAYDIRVPEHLSNFRCDSCGTEQIDVNVNTQLKYSTDVVFNENIGTGDAVEKVFQLGQTNYVIVDNAMKVYTGGLLRTRGEDYTATAEGVITFVKAPENGAVITASYTFENGSMIVVPCTGCSDVTNYPREGGGPITQQLAAAKTE